jgi:hypothetical protein
VGTAGGPPLEPRDPGRPGISTPELRERLLELLCEGLPLRVICRMPGMPSREAVYAWRRIDPAFDRSCRFMAQEGRINLIELVSEEFDRLMEQAGPAVARRVFDLRRRQLKPGDTVITAKLDRMFRSALDALGVLADLKTKGVSLHMIDLGGDVTGNGISKLVFTILSAVAEAERDRIRERSKYPPAKPGALEFWPLKAAGKVANAASGCVSRSKRLSGALTRPRVQVATEVAVTARGSSAPGVGPPALGCGCSSGSPLRPARPWIRNTRAPRSSAPRNSVAAHHRRAPSGWRSSP